MKKCLYLLSIMTMCTKLTAHTPDSLQPLIYKAESFPLEKILTRYQKDFNVPTDQAKEHEKELKRYLILAVISETQLPMMSREIDNLWHTFIIFTKDYCSFCREIAGKYIHHTPKSENKQNPENESENAKKFIERYTEFFGFQPSPIIWKNVYDICSTGACSGCSNRCGAVCTSCDTDDQA